MGGGFPESIYMLGYTGSYRNQCTGTVTTCDCSDASVECKVGVKVTKFDFLGALNIKIWSCGT